MKAAAMTKRAARRGVTSSTRHCSTKINTNYIIVHARARRARDGGYVVSMRTRRHGLRPSLVQEFMPLMVFKFSSMSRWARRAAPPARMSDSRCDASVARTPAPMSFTSSRVVLHCASVSDVASRRDAAVSAETRLARSSAFDDNTGASGAVEGFPDADADAVDDALDNNARLSASASTRASTAAFDVDVDVDVIAPPTPAPTRAKLSAAPSYHVALPTNPSSRLPSTS